MVHPEERNEYNDFVFLFAPQHYTEIALIKSIFEGGDIVYFIQGEDIGVAPGGLPARILVKKEQLEEATGLLKEFGLL